MRKVNSADWEPVSGKLLLHTHIHRPYGGLAACMQ